MSPKCSSVVVTTSSSGPRSSPARTMLQPSVVDAVRATCSHRRRRAPPTAPGSPREAARIRSKRAMLPRPSVDPSLLVRRPWPRGSRCSAARRCRPGGTRSARAPETARAPPRTSSPWASRHSAARCLVFRDARSQSLRRPRADAARPLRDRRGVAARGGGRCRRGLDECGCDESEELYGDYQLVVDTIGDRLHDFRETYASTLDGRAADEYRSAFNRAAAEAVPPVHAASSRTTDGAASRTTPCSATCRAPPSSTATGCIEWLCLPRFDSGACFAALVGTEENGHWTLQPDGRVPCDRPALPRRHARPRDRARDRRGRGAAHRLHASEGDEAGRRPHRRGPPRTAWRCGWSSRFASTTGRSSPGYGTSRGR